MPPAKLGTRPIGRRANCHASPIAPNACFRTMTGGSQGGKRSGTGNATRLKACGSKRMAGRRAADGGRIRRRPAKAPSLVRAARK